MSTEEAPSVVALRVRRPSIHSHVPDLGAAQGPATGGSVREPKQSDAGRSGKKT